MEERIMRKIKKLLVGLLVSASMFITTVSPALAAEETVSMEVETASPRAGNETWSGAGHGGSYTFTNNNLTPIKTIGESGRLLISGSFYGTDAFASSSPIKLTFQIRSTSGTVLASTEVIDTRNGNIPFSVATNVTVGQQVRLFLDASSIANPPGIYRSAYVYYNYAII